MLMLAIFYEKSVALYNWITGRFPGINFKIYGIYFSKLRNLKRYIFRKYKKYYSNAGLTSSVLNELYSKTRICMNFHHNQLAYGVNQRFLTPAGPEFYRFATGILL